MIPGLDPYLYLPGPTSITPTLIFERPLSPLVFLEILVFLDILLFLESLAFLAIYQTQVFINEGSRIKLSVYGFIYTHVVI